MRTLLLRALRKSVRILSLKVNKPSIKKAVELCVLILHDFLLFVASLQLACEVGGGRYFLSLSSDLLSHIF